MALIRRTIWLAAGVAIGWVWGFLSLRRLARRSRSALDPATLVESAADAGEKVGRRVSDAIKVGRDEARRREADLRTQLGVTP